ncbi:MAG: hypothetical protein ACLU3I_04625 [Acutalibacteraceae bacterium]
MRPSSSSGRCCSTITRVINEFLQVFGADKIDWLKSDYCMVVIVVLFLWKNLGYNMILFMAALSNIPRELLEVAEVEERVGGLPVLSHQAPISVADGFVRDDPVHHQLVQGLPRDLSSHRQLLPTTGFT